MADKGTCSVNGCDRGAQTAGKCNMHYLRWRRHGDTGDPRRLRKPAKGQFCEIDDCGDPVLARMMCSVHYDRWCRTGTTEPPWRLKTPPVGIRKAGVG